MNEPSIERIFSLEEIDYARFWGQNDKLLEFVRLLFPKLKLIVRGDMLKAIGSEEDIAWFDGKLQAMMTYYDKFGRLTENAIMGIMESGGGSPSLGRPSPSKTRPSISSEHGISREWPRKRALVCALESAFVPPKICTSAASVVTSSTCPRRRSPLGAVTSTSSL